MSGKKFRFSLQNVLDLRSYETDQIEQALQSAVANRQAQEQRVTAARDQLRSIATQSTDARATDLRTLRQYDALRQHAQQALAESQARLQELRDQEAQVRQRWVECRQAQERLQSLHDKEETQHQKAQAEAELAFTDEQSVMRYCRSNRTSLL